MFKLPLLLLIVMVLGSFIRPLCAEMLPSEQLQGAPDLRTYEIAMPGQPRWNHVVLGSQIGVGLFDFHDLNGDGELELITSGGGGVFSDGREIGAIFVLRSDLQEPVCVLQEFKSGILDHSYIQSGAGAKIKVILVSEAEVLLFDPMECSVETQFSFPTAPDFAKIGQLVGDAEPEIVFSSDGHLRVTPWNHFAIIAERLNFNARALTVGGVTASDKGRIVAQNESLQILDGGTLATVVTIPNADEDFLATADLDGDGIEEILGAKKWTDGITAFSTSTFQPLFNVPVFNLGFLSTQDFDGDGRSEILYADRQHGGVHVLDSNGEPLFSMWSPSRAIGVKVVDIRPEEGYEIVFPSGAFSTAQDRILVANADTQTFIEGTTYYTDDFGIQIIDGDRIVVGFNDRGNRDPSVSGRKVSGFYIMDRRTGYVLNEYNFPRLFSISSIENSITASAALAEDEAGVICVPNGYSNTHITCLSTVDLSVVWERSFSGGRVTETALMDVDQDGIKDLVSLHTDGYLYAHSQVNGFLLWRSELLDLSVGGRGWSYITEIDEEIWLTDGAGNLLVFERSSGDLLHVEAQANLTFLQQYNNEYFALRQGVGYGRIDAGAGEFELLYPVSDPVDWLELSTDGRFLLLRSTAENVASVRIIDIVNDFNQLIIGDLAIIDSRFIDADELILATSAGIFSYSVTALFDNVFSDRFSTN